MVFILSPGANPMSSLLKLAQEKHMSGDKFRYSHAVLFLPRRCRARVHLLAL